jgi:hypothetical protein
MFLIVYDRKRGGMSGVDLQKFIETIRGLTTEQTATLLNNIEKYEGLHSTLVNLPEETRESILNKIGLFAKCDAKEDQLNEKGHYLPEIRKLDFVHVDFTGVGSEWDGGHYGLVWNVNPKFDSFVVIPTTSQNRTEYADVFPVGRILGLPKGTTTLLVSDMTRVSRKRIEPVTFNHFQKGLTTSRLKRDHISRIEEAIAVTYGNQTTFERFLSQNTLVAMPEDLSPIYAWRFKPIVGRFDPKNLIFYYRLWNKDIWHRMKMVNPKEKITKEKKQDIIKNLFSMDDQKRTVAEEEYAQLYNNAAVD